MGKWFNKNWLFGPNSLFAQGAALSSTLIGAAAPAVTAGVISKDKADKFLKWGNPLSLLANWVAGKPKQQEQQQPQIIFTGNNEPQQSGSINYYRVGGVIAVLGVIIYFFNKKKRR